MGLVVVVVQGGGGGYPSRAIVVCCSLAAAGHLQFVLGDIVGDPHDSPLHKALAKHSPYDLVCAALSRVAMPAAGHTRVWRPLSFSAAPRNLARPASGVRDFAHARSAVRALPRRA